MKRALLVLRPKERAIFTVRAATQGVHPSRLYPPGSVLLGWAAGHYADFNRRKSAFHIFHSGRVRFSDALPLSSEQHVAYPMPKNLFHQKGGEPAIDGALTRNISRDHVWVGRRAYHADNDIDGVPEFQPEVVSSPGVPFVTLSLSAPAPATGGRLRTSTEKGRAKEGALFGYTHLDPFARNDPDKACAYVATVEADEIDDRDWQALRDTFNRQELRLGRASSTGYGGWYDCAWREEAEADFIDPWQRVPSPGGERFPADIARVWVLSDLALLNAHGEPDLAPPAAIFGFDGRPDKSECAVTVRRYAPWNRQLETRDVERMVIEAGSVLTYKVKGALPQERCRTVGLWQEQGLGRVWIDPPMLRGRHPEIRGERAVQVPDGAQEDHVTRAPTKPPEGIASWADAMSVAMDEAARHDLLQTWSAALDRVFGSGDGPSPSQWHAAAAAARRAKDRNGIVTALFAGNSPACGRDDDRTRRGDWHLETRIGERRQKLRDWLRDEIRRESANTDVPLGRIVWALDQLAKEAGRRKREARDRPDG